MSLVGGFVTLQSHIESMGSVSLSLSYSSTTTAELSTLLNTTYVKMVASTTIEFKPTLSSYSNLAMVILQ